MKFTVAKMSCEGCAKTVKNAILNLDADSNVQIDLATKTVEIEANAEKDEILAALEKAGYPAITA